MPTAGPRPSRALGVLVAAFVAVVASMAVVWHGSYATWSATTADAGDSWAAGTVSLADDDSGAALFSAAGLKPGSSGAQCVAVTATGTLPATVRLYVTGLTATNGLSAHLNASVSWGTGGSFGNCAGFTQQGVLWSGALSAFPATTWATGLGSWATSGTPGEVRVYRISWTLSTTAPETVQGGTAAGTFTWEAQAV
ncbi:hypothetical protein [Modestobacter sp. SSW1-42]|uniref:hypothetical protein n=1 Tax=Modestobacter sp. SSW1-42 TaxID=596372 RepID=UPI00398707C4